MSLFRNETGCLYWGQRKISSGKRKFSVRKPVVIDGRLSTEPTPVIERFVPRKQSEPWTLTQFMLAVAAVGILAAIAVSTDWSYLWSVVP